jgi:RNA polymerase-associated protein CTR9
VGLAQMDLIDNNIKGAVERFSEALSRAPDNKELVLVLGALHKKYKKLLSRKIDKNSGKFKLSTRMVKDNSLRALKYLKQATDLDATNADAQIEMAEMKQAVGTDQHYRTALKHYMKAERSKVTAGDDVAPQIHINQGVLHFQLGEYEKAMQAYERAFAEEDDSSHSSSSSSSAIDDTTPLKTIFNKFSSIMYDAKNITMTYNFARLCESMKDYDLAKEIYSTLSSKYPMYVESFLRLADIAYTLEKDVDSALEYIFDALCINPENASALSMQGNMYLRKGEVGKAQVSFEALVQLKSKSKRTGDSYALLSLANIEFGRSEKLRMKGGLLSTKAKSHLENAQRIYERCLTSDIKNTYAANGLGIVMAELGHAKAATDIFSKINEQSSMLHSRINLAHMYMSNEEVNQSREAVKLYEICVEQCDKNDVELHSEYLMYLARAYARSEQFEKALTILEQCKELNPNDSNIWFNIASTQTRYANHSLEKARSDARFLKVKVVQKSIDLLKSSRKYFILV